MATERPAPWWDEVLDEHGRRRPPLDLEATIARLEQATTPPPAQSRHTAR